MINDDQILGLIPTGYENRISSSELETLTQVNRRQLKSCISRLRRNGALICSSVYVGGYFKPQSREELETWYKVECARNRTHKAALRQAKKALENWTTEV